MALTDRIVTLAWLIRIDLPGETLRLCDGGLVTWGGDSYRARHPSFGVPGAVDFPDEESGDEGPGATITFLPASAAAAATLSNPAYQDSPFRIYEAEVDRTTGQVIGEPVTVASLLLDTTTLRIGKGYRELDMGLVSEAERLFEINIGNSLSPTFHKSVWAGELGLDNATGAPSVVAWGVEGTMRGAGGLGGGGGGTGGGASNPYVHWN